MPELGYHAARADELDMIHAELMAVIDEFAALFGALQGA